jgi:phospholipase A1
VRFFNVKKYFTATAVFVLIAGFTVSYAQPADNTQVVSDQTITNDAATETTAPAVKPIKHHVHHVTQQPQPQTVAEFGAQKIDADKHNESLQASPVVARASEENRILENPFSIAFYKPTYVLPYYYTRMPDNAVYEGQTPQGESLKKSEVKYQLSFKVPIWHRIFSLPSTLYFAYTQLSYWQLYDKSAFFRETDYEPEAFLANEVNLHLFGNWHVNFLNLGAVHQSNGFGGDLERSWNRIYFNAIASNDNWVISIRPWYVFHDSTYEMQNPHMAKYLGHEQITISCKLYSQVLSLEARNALEHHGRYAAATASWSFPITKHINGYLQVFSGYGQSLIEYNHRTNSVGVGIALSNWV